MSISFNNIKGNISVISSLDGAVNCSDEAYEKYLETLDEGLLELSGEPTRFLLKRTLGYQAHRSVKSAQIERDGKDMKMTTAFIMEHVRQSLVGIENPVGVKNPLEFKKDGDGGASKDLIAVLESLGIVMELYSAIGSEKDKMGGVKKS